MSEKRIDPFRIQKIGPLKAKLAIFKLGKGQKRGITAVHAMNVGPSKIPVGCTIIILAQIRIYFLTPCSTVNCVLDE